MNGKDGKILIIDDSPLNIFVLTSILSEEYTVHSETDPQRGIEAVKSFKPDLILLDIVMPEISGFGVIKFLKENKATSDIPVIFLTGLKGSKYEREGLSLGAVDYVIKPFDGHTVLLRVKTQFKIINLMKELYALSMKDSLTGISNRRHLNEILSVEFKRGVRNKRPLGFIIADIDYFKKFNDTYGHLFGDEVLKGIAKILKSGASRISDAAARWGGEEFAVVLPETDIKGVVVVAEDIRVNVEKTEFQLEDDVKANVTVSMGVNSIIVEDISDQAIAKFVAEADEALYKAKERGRNRVVAVESKSVGRA